MTADEYLLDTPVVRTFIDGVRLAIDAAVSPADACERIRPGFATLLADPDWLPAAYREPAVESGMGGGIGQWLLYGAGDGSLSLFSLVVPAAAETPVHDHLAWGLGTGCVWRHAYDPESGEALPFRSGYVNVDCQGQ